MYRLELRVLDEGGKSHGSGGIKRYLSTQTPNIYLSNVLPTAEKREGRHTLFHDHCSFSSRRNDLTSEVQSRLQNV